LTCAAVCMTVAPAVAAAPPSIRLRADWYVVTTPYRYDVGQRYEAGWHRGADVRPAGGVVRAVTSGVVRFVGAVAGRRIVTVHDRTHGIVVTYVGLDGIHVQPGQRVTPGVTIGAGHAVHVGAYDDAHRERYVPIVGGTGAPGIGGTAGDDSLSGAVVGRLRDAALGEASPGAGQPGGGQLGAPIVHAPLVRDVLGAHGAPTASGALTAPAATVPARVVGRSLGAVTSTPSRSRVGTGTGSSGSSGAGPNELSGVGSVAPSAVKSTVLDIASFTGLIGIDLPASDRAAAPRTHRTLARGARVGAARRETLAALHTALIGGGHARAPGPANAPAPPPGSRAVTPTPSTTPMPRAVAAIAAGRVSADDLRPREPPHAAPHRPDRWSAHPLLGLLAGCALVAVVGRALRRRRGGREVREDQVGTRAGIGVPLLVLPQSIEPGSPEIEERAAIAWSDPPPDRARIPEHA
ncbi:MAG: Peptidase family, partial [Thermoleophilia bacterium]|nr:Peptidase family [Thermoleophilia bacterium]